MSLWDNHKLDKSSFFFANVFNSCKTKHIYLIHDNHIMTLDLNQNLIVYLFLVYVGKEHTLLSVLCFIERVMPILRLDNPAQIVIHKWPAQLYIYINKEQIITGYPTDGAMGSLGGGWVWELSVVCLHNNANVARGILVTILHCGTPEPCLSAIYIASSVGTSLRHNWSKLRRYIWTINKYQFGSNSNKTKPFTYEKFL